MSTSHPRAAARFVPPALLVLLAFIRFLPYRAFEPDDLYIYLQFVRNLLARGELAFNAGQPTYGFTSALWLFVLAGATAVFRDPFLAAKIASLLPAVASPALLYLVALRLGRERTIAFLAGLAWAWNGWLVRWSWSGLEGALSAVVPLAAILLLLRARDEGRAPRGAAWVAGIAPLVRPEMIGFWMLFVAHDALATRGSFPARLRRTMSVALPGLLLTGGWWLFAWNEFGRILPNTAPAKGALVPMMSGFLPAGARIVQSIAATAAVELAAIVVAALLAARGGVRRMIAERDPDAYGLMAAWSAGLVFLYCARGVTVYTRYLLMILPFVVVGGYRAFLPLWSAGGRRRALALLLIGIGLGQNLVLDWKVIRPATRNYERSERSVNVAIGEWLRDRTPPGAVVAALDIGAIGYMSRRTVLDMNGLVTPDLIPYKRNGQVNEYLTEHPPDYIVDVSSDPEHLLKEGLALHLRLLQSRPFENMFLLQKGPLYYSLYAVESGSGGDAGSGGEDRPR